MLQYEAVFWLPRSVIIHYTTSIREYRPYLCWCVILPDDTIHCQQAVQYAVHVVHLTNPTLNLDLWSSWDSRWDDSVHRPSIFSIRRPSGRGQNCGDWFSCSSHGTVCSCDSIYLHKRWYAPGVHSKLNPSFKSAMVLLRELHKSCLMLLLRLHAP